MAEKSITLLKVFLTLPIGSASAERTMSVSQVLKGYLIWSTVVQNSTSNLALLCMEYNEAL